MTAVVLVCIAFWSATAYARHEPVIFSATKQPCANCRQKIPIHMALRLNDIADADELFREFVGQQEVEPQMLRGTQFRAQFTPKDSNIIAGELQAATENGARKAKPAGCAPELRTVSLRQSEDPWVYYWPSCTRVEQCGGCCSHELLSCQPVEIQTLKFEVVKMEYVGTQMQYKGKVIVEAQNHTRCKCDCVVKEKDCRSWQEYRPSECRCVCRNTEDKALCSSQQAKDWDSDSCSCRCVKVFDCSLGTVFSQTTCNCEQVSAQALLGSSYLQRKSANLTSTSRTPTHPNHRRKWQPHDRSRYNTIRPRH